MSEDPRRVAPAVARNRDPLLAARRPLLHQSGLVLEVASGSGEHVAHFAPALPDLTWQPSAPLVEERASIDAWCAGLPNVRPALTLDVMALSWPIDQADAVLCVNMIHIAPRAATLALLAGAAGILAPGAPLILYGPFLQAGVPTAQGNLDFDAKLRAENPAWGLRALEAVAKAAERFGPPQITPMPANNLTVAFRRL